MTRGFLLRKECEVRKVVASLPFLIGTVLFDSSGKKYYLLNGKQWLTATKLEGPWTVTTQLQKENELAQASSVRPKVQPTALLLHSSQQSRQGQFNCLIEIAGTPNRNTAGPEVPTIPATGWRAYEEFWRGGTPAIAVNYAKRDVARF
jgi:hypothetical protein